MSSAETATAAGAAATQQQQSPVQTNAQQPAQVTQSATQTTTAPAAAPAQAASSAANDGLTCQWQNCGERCINAEQLYDHVCERHVGRKSTNNLNLTCQWGTCRTTTVKRDHITSHIRVHVPLKPHKCDFCGKAFKRPQDLKKHVKTHADDSVLLHSPEPGAARGGAGNAFQPATGKHFSDLQSLAATASGFYPDAGMGHAPSYAHHPGAGGAGFYAGNQASAYGPVYYALQGGGLADLTTPETRKRALDALNDLFGEAKRRTLDLNSYAEVGQRLTALQGLPLPIPGAYYGNVLPEYQSQPALISPGGHATHGYSLPLPLPNARTKQDLLNIDQFLEQLQATIYENPNQAAASGVAQAGAHYMHPGFGAYRTSHSPPGATQLGNAHLATPHTSAGLGTASLASAPLDTPALTPESSAMSYTSGQSPGSVHSQQTVSPTARTSLYPTLPAVSAMSDFAGAYTATSSGPASALGTAFDADGRRRYSGGMLQKANVPRGASEDRMDTSDSGSSRRASTITPTNVDPQLSGALRSPSMASDSNGETAADREQETWVENIRVIEALRAYVKDRLTRGVFDDEDGNRRDDDHEMGDASGIPSMPRGSHSDSLYPVLKVDE